MKRNIGILGIIATLILVVFASWGPPAQAQVTQPGRFKILRICNLPELLWAMGHPGWIVRSTEQTMPASTENGLTNFWGVLPGPDGDPCINLLMSNREWDVTEVPPTVLVEWSWSETLSPAWNADIQQALGSRGQRGIVVPFPTPIPQPTLPPGGKTLP